MTFAIALSVVVGAFAMWLYCRSELSDLRADLAVVRARLRASLPCDVDAEVAADSAFLDALRVELLREAVDRRAGGAW